MQTSSASQQKWDHRYQHKSTPSDVCDVLQENLHLLPKKGRSLDLACGLGANALCLAAQGLESHGWDLSAVALAKLTDFAKQQSLYVMTQQRDIEQQPPTTESFDVIVVSQFLYRPIMAALMTALKPQGLLFYQTFNQSKLDEKGPSKPEFLLSRNELRETFADLHLLYYREDGRVGDLSNGRRNCSYFIGQKS